MGGRKVVKEGGRERERIRVNESRWEGKRMGGRERGGERMGGKEGWVGWERGRKRGRRITYFTISLIST